MPAKSSRQVARRGAKQLESSHPCQVPSLLQASVGRVGEAEHEGEQTHLGDGGKDVEESTEELPGGVQAHAR